MDHPAQEAFDALSDPVRRAILQLLSDHGEMTAGDIARGIDGVGRTAVSTHLRILRKSGLVSERRAGRYRYVSLELEGPMRDAMSFLQGVLGQGIPDPDQSSIPDAKSIGDVTDEAEQHYA